MSSQHWSAKPIEDFPPDLADALKQAQHAVSLEPTSAKAHAHMGLVLDRGGKPREAIDLLRTAVNLAPRRASHHDELGMVYRRAALSIDGFIERGRGYVMPPVERMPGGEDTCWRQRPEPTCFPLEHYSRTQLHIAEEDFLRRTSADDQDFHGFGLLATLYRNRSIDSCATALRLDPSRATPYLTIARTLPRGGSVALYKNALALLPNHASLHREFGGLLAELRYYSQANNIFRTAIALEPRSHLAYESLADLRLLRNRPREAYDIAHEALALHTDAPDPPNAADPYATGGGQDEAYAADASKAASSRSWWWAGQGDTSSSSPADKAAARRARRAARDARETASRAAESPKAAAIASAIAIMAEAMCHQGNWGDAASLARSAVAIAPQSARGYKQLTHALFEQVELDRRGRLPTYKGGAKSDNPDMGDGALGAAAIEAGEAASKLAPRDAGTHYRTGRMLRRVPGKLQKAIEHFNGCIRVNGTYPGIEEAQEEAVGKMRLLEKPKRGVWDVVQNLVPVLVLMIGMAHVMMA